MNAILYIHGKGGSALECEHWFHTEEQMVFLDNWIKLAFRMCKFYPELMDELKRTIEAMEIGYYKPAVKCVRSRILDGKLK